MVCFVPFCSGKQADQKKHEIAWCSWKTLDGEGAEEKKEQGEESKIQSVMPHWDLGSKSICKPMMFGEMKVNIQNM